MIEPALTVVIPAYNCADYIEETLNSVLKQTFADFEVIVVDDASTDNSLQLLHQLALADSRLRILSLATNSGQAVCRNRAVTEARGRYIAFLDADDVWLPQKLERQLEFLAARKLPFCFCGYGTIDERSDTIIGDLKIPGRTEYNDLLKSNTICASSVVYDRQLMDDIVMPERPRRREDLISWLAASRALGGFLYGIPDPLCMIRRLPGSSSSNKLRALRWQWAVYREVVELDPLRSLYYLICFAMTSLAKRSAFSVTLKQPKR